MLKTMILGAHESVAGGPHTAIARGMADGCEAIQIFARPSSQWRAKPFQPEEISLFRSEHATVGWPTMSHASYLINLSAGNPEILEKSRDALADEMCRAEELGLDYVVLHPGAHLGAGVADGIAAAADSLSELHARTGGMRVRLLLEITAGQGSCLGCRFEEMEAMLSRARGGDTIGICFDTCHAHASGYDLSTEEGYERTFDAFARVIGLDRLRAFHLNDSKTPTGSHVDRHAEIGEGYLGLLPFWRLVNDPRFAATPGVLETPDGPDGRSSFARNLQRLRALAGARRPAGPPKSQALPDKGDPRQGRLFA
jgi:deoxyribonuclease IV